jgi:hypothetical protein
MKIDLHCHTKAIKNGDGPGRNVTPELFKEKIENADIKIVAITNHNAFDLEQYNKLSNIVSGTCQVWPGVEIDVLEPGSNRWHLIVVVNPKEVEAFSTNVSVLFNGDDVDECTHTLDEIHTAFKERDAIYIAHFYKDPAIPEKDSDKLYSLVGESYRVFKETTNEKSMSIFANNRYNILVGSDVKDWNKYERSSFSELKLPVDSFEQFCLLAKRDANVVQTLLNKKESQNLIAHPAPNESLSIQIYADMNIIFGQKGTGKTEIIKSLYESMKANGYKCVLYVASERDGEFKSLLGTSGLIPNVQKMGVNTCEDEFKTIITWRDSNPTHFCNYYNWKNTEGNNANKARMKITHASSLNPEINENEESHQIDNKNISAIFRDLYKIDLKKYLNDIEIDQLNLLIKKLKNNIHQQWQKDLIDKYAVHLANFTINKIKQIADKNTNSVSKPSTTGLVGFANSRLFLLKAIKKILKNLSIEEINEKEKIGSLDEKGVILINTKFRMICPLSRKDEFKIGITKLKKIKELLISLKVHIFDSDISKDIQDLCNILDEENITSIIPFIGRSKQVIDQNGNQYTPSNGEKGMLLLQKTIMEDADAYFLDEPELGMGNSYIDSSIRPILIDLSKQHKYVTVATHNANIGVRTLPYMSIYRTHSNGIYTTYIGNPFSNKLVDINDENIILNWAEESLKSLEGSKDAFYERKDIYESNND